MSLRLVNESDCTGKEKITFADVAGMSKVKEAIRMSILYPLKHPELAAQYGIKAGGGLLLYGPPGCGKTFIARAIAGEINANFISCSLHELLGPYFGDSNRNLNRLFETARRTAPSVVFFDEIDAVAAKRGKLFGPMRTLVTQLLSELDGERSYNKDVFVIAATNRPWDIDDAMLRSGRLTSAMFIPPPDLQARAEIFHLNLAASPCTDDIDFAEVARLSKGLSSADVKQACVAAKESAFRSAITSGQVIAISQEILVNAVKATKPSISQWLDTAGAYVTHSNAAGQYDDIKAYLKDGN